MLHVKYIQRKHNKMNKSRVMHVIYKQQKGKWNNKKCKINAHNSGTIKDNKEVTTHELWWVKSLRVTKNI